MVDRCWICGGPADSAEHRFKKADIVRAYGRGPYGGDTGPVHISGDTRTHVQGPRSVAIKYEPSLCHRCNTARTQILDKTYDQLIDWVLANEVLVLRKRSIDFEERYK